MLVVDSSVWIDFFADRPTAACDELDRLLQDGQTRLVVPDVVLYEVLRGFRHERAMRQARTLLQTLSVEPCGGADVALAAAEHYRHLRARGITVRASTGVMVAAFCIERDYLLLHRDRDYDGFAAHRGLRIWEH
ncbi:PIN domain nuclease [Comamonas sp. NLF-1-9]|uniref:type II toxin-antitoxin system VapC family toxin n=1 Tax=Comamonas sp. NLF-1-9 TaxID=2853163 RepID=UPI001C48B908|nr:PIN domain nuclease [Comamonas sp. NLF-1-9]QXL84377.1 PIN domain nuclease [Comamonas sp. NLF-1-9]